MSPRGGKVPTGDMPRDAKPPNGGSKPDATGGLEARDVVADALWRRGSSGSWSGVAATVIHDYYLDLSDFLLAALDLPALLAEARAEALNEAADAWQQGQWADAPRRNDRVQERLANAQHVTDWLRARAGGAQ